MDKSTSRFLRSASFRQLQVFESIARTGGFTSAAKELYLTQPTVSQQMKKLEEDLGVILFDQVGRKVYLTEAGTALLDSCREIFDSIAGFEEAVIKSTAPEGGEFALSGVTTTEYFIPLLLSSFCHRYPMINVKLTINDRGTVIDRIQNNEDDLYLISQLPDIENLDSELFLTNPLVLVCNPAHPLANERDISFEQLLDENILLREEHSGTCIALQSYLNKNQHKLNVRMRFNSNEAIKQGVMHNLGIALLSMYVIQEDVKDGRLVVLDVKGFPLNESWHFLHQKNRQLSPIAKLFKEFVLKEGRDLISSTFPGLDERQLTVVKNR